MSQIADLAARILRAIHHERTIVGRYPDPRKAVATIEAHLKLLDEARAEKHIVVDGDCWYTCAVATDEHDGGTTCRDNGGLTCDCGRDTRVHARLRVLASAYLIDPDTSLIVLRPAAGLPQGFMPHHLDGRWEDLDTIPGFTVNGSDAPGAVAKPTGRYETRADGAIAEVWEVGPAQ